jgi:hypothetical protein
MGLLAVSGIAETGFMVFPLDQGVIISNRCRQASPKNDLARVDGSKLLPPDDGLLSISSGHCFATARKV